MRISIKRAIGAGVGAAAACTFALSTSAEAVVVDYSQSWNDSASYRASGNFVPGSSNIHVGTFACAGGYATYSYTSLVKALGSELKFSGYSYAADDAWHDDPRTADRTPVRPLTYRFPSAFLVAALLAVSACGASDRDSEKPPAPPKPGAAYPQILLALVGQGEVRGISWKVELFREGPDLCTQATVSGITAGHGCNPPVATDMPANYILDRTGDRITLIYGAALPSVTRITMTDTARAATDVPLVVPPDAGAPKFFAAPIDLGTVTGLAAFDAGGNRLAPIDGKILDAKAPQR